ncbi:MAG TPA: hypothetical protein VNF07_12935 [Acidimicrobiales bacterium]|nr:hypothetical protein [Acidimicrobiales bacterium]
MSNHKWQMAMSGALIASGAFSFAAAAGAAPASATGATGAQGSKFTQQKQQLEQQLANRATQLQHLLSDVQGAHSLTTQDANTLSARITTEQASINALVAKVPNDATFAQLRADRAAMLKDNRVYVVMTPQVFITIEGDSALAQANVLVGNEATLSSEVSSLNGLPGYQNALNHYNKYVTRVAHVTTNMTSVVARVLAQTPQGYPGNTHVFVSSNEQVRDANISMANASYDASVIALATGGYTGS